MGTQPMETGRMNAVFLEGAGRTAYKSVDMPHCGPGEALIKVRCVGICGTDVEMYKGHITKITYPIIPGHEWSGEIVALGRDVVGFAVGDRVVGETTIACGHCSMCKQGRYNFCRFVKESGVFGKHGAAAEYMVHPASALHLVHPSVSFEQACLIEPSAVAFRGLERIKASPRDVLAVIGPGAIGLMTVVMAKQFGVRKVVLVGFEQKRLQLGLKLGADEIIDLSQEDYSERARECTDGELFTAIVEASGNKQACEDLFAIAAVNCRVCLLGSYGAELPRIDATKIVERDMEVFGSLSSPGVWEMVVKLNRNSRIRITDIITHEFKLEDYEKAVQLLARRDPSVLKVIIKP